MITLLLIIGTLLATAFYIIKNVVSTKTNYGTDRTLPTNKLLKGILIFVLGIIISISQPLSIERVDAGHVGIMVNLTGDNRGIGKFEYKTGWVVVNNWIEKLYEFPTFQQHITYPEQQVITKGGFPTTIKPSFNYSLKPGDIGDMFSSLRLGVRDIEQQWLQTAIVGAVNDVSNRWTVDDIFNEREKFEAAIVTEANKRVSKWFAISQLRTNIVPPDALVKSISEKTQAIQQVQVADNMKLVAVARGQEQIAKAKADSAVKVMNAAAEAQSIKIKQLSLTPEYIEYLKVTRWDGQLPTYQGGNGSMIMQLPK